MRNHGIANLDQLCEHAVYRRIETDTKVGICQVVVYCARQCDGGNAHFTERAGAMHGTVAPDGDDALQIKCLGSQQCAALPFLYHKFLAAGGF